MGCNAEFQSKRSRDRHSANNQLHQKLLSTVATCASLDADTPSSSTAVVRRSAEDRSLSQSSTTWLHEEQSIKSAAAACFYYMQLRYGPSNCSALQSVVKPHWTTYSRDKTSSSNTLIQCLDCRRLDGSTDDHGLESRITNSRGSSPDVIESTLGSTRSAIDTAPRPEPDGTAVCHVCSQTFQDNLVLKEHIEKLHPREMYRCTVPGCDKIFSTRKSRNRHSQNDNLHYVFPSDVVTSLMQRRQ